MLCYKVRGQNSSGELPLWLACRAWEAARLRPRPVACPLGTAELLAFQVLKKEACMGKWRRLGSVTTAAGFVGLRRMPESSDGASRARARAAGSLPGDPGPAQER